MDCLKLLEALDVLGCAGICISTENSQLLQNSLLILQTENHFRKCYYWGRINGLQNDYHIAYGFEKDCMLGQVYYYSIDGMNWLLLPKATKCGRFLSPLAINKFEGDPSIVTNVYNINPPFPPNEDPKTYYDIAKPAYADSVQSLYKFLVPNRHQIQYMTRFIRACCQFDAKKMTKPGYVRRTCTLSPDNLFAGPVTQGPMPKELKEEDRLAATVELITEDAAIIPRGAWFKCPNGDVIENPSFGGLCSVDAMHLKSYLHARSPKEKWNTNLLSRPDYNYALDFLDSIDMDVPQECWDLQFMLGGRLAILHSLYWHGITFFHKLNSPHYGFLYVGHGKKNLDLPFMF